MKRLHAVNGGGRDEERKRVRSGESGGMLGSADRGREGGCATTVTACCDKHRPKSSSGSDTAATFECVCVTSDSLNPDWSPTHMQNSKTRSLNASLPKLQQ